MGFMFQWGWIGTKKQVSKDIQKQDIKISLLYIVTENNKQHGI